MNITDTLITLLAVKNEAYPRNDIGTARLFYDLHSGVIRYVVEAKTWYVYDGKRWLKDEGGFRTMEMCKTFATAYSDYAANACSDDTEFLKYAGKLANRRNRESVLNDAKSIAPMSLSAFDTNRYLLNLQNGTYNLQNFTLQPHRAEDYVTKIARVRYNPKACCPRWERFIDEIMCGDVDTAVFLQKALGYALTGDTNAHNSFYILYGASTRNGKSTLTEAIGYILGDYARTAQPQTLARRSTDGAAPSPDIARLKGARFVCTPEPEKGLELNSALMKQLTGGDTYVGRFLNENPFEFVPEFHIFFNTNHLPRTNDDTIFASGRVKIIPFERHFTDAEQDHGLKGLFRKADNKSAILNWLIDGYRLMLDKGMDVSARMQSALDEYRTESDILGGFFAEKIIPAEGKKLQTSALYAAYTVQMRLSGSRPMSVQSFVGEVKKRYQVGRDRSLGTVVYNAALANL
jgi:putative DNA primase/helicase